MTKSVQNKHSKTTTKKSKAEKEAETEALEAELEPKYAIDRFYSLRRMHNAFCALIIGFNLFSFHFLPAARYETSVCSCLWSTYFVLSKYVSRYRGTKHDEYGKKLFKTASEGLFLIHEIFQARNLALASEEGRNAHASMVCLTKYFIAQTMFNIASNPRFKATPFHLLEFLAQPLLVLQKPRFGIFKPKYEALAFLTALGLGSVVGSVIDEMRWRHFLVLHKNELEMKEHKRTSRRAMALEDIACCQESPFFDIIRQ